VPHDIEDRVWCAVTETIIGTSFFFSIINSETYSGQILTPLAEILYEEKEYGFLQKIVQPST
jgi:ABC-type enterochelin transport system permease subunit